ncbi:CinA family protein [Agromyces aerolatus]|uniref:CinA family protein n=1 Tax=Agromyces sp. LY-1074 TaxID=3074080 RepID=UPI002862C90A|nr:MULTISPECIES: CinA family protein [unclassified Agromyces]MDR5701024.1 CinA family protein [Agromyces sp. LY-1074]MDR5707664.1 CinA family protein [Agromyces sp. LY-1358]
MTASEAERLVATLTRHARTLAVAESLTGGLLAARIVSVPGASAVLTGGIVAYATELKATILGVDSGLLARRGAVDADVARQMADHVRSVCAVAGRPADLGLATTGVAGPDPQDGHPPGTVYLGIASPRGIRSVPLELDGSRADIRTHTVARALDEALAELAAMIAADAE